MKTRIARYWIGWMVLAGFLLIARTPAQAQGQEKLVMFTGIITAGKTSEPLPGAYVYIPKAGRGILSNNVGYFALPVMPGDSVIFSYVGYKKQFYVIPRRLTETTFSAVIAMQEDVQTLTEVKVYPYATEELFKEAFVNMTLPDQKERENLARNTSAESMQRLAAITPMSAQANYRYYTQQQWFGRESVANRSGVTTFPFLNPFAWANFIRSVKNGELNKKEYRKELNATPKENLRREDLIKN